MTSTSSHDELCLHPGLLIGNGGRFKATMKPTAFEESAVERRSRRELSFRLGQVGFGMVELRAHSGDDLPCRHRLPDVESQ